MGAVNAGSVSDALSGPNKPWYTLARRLGLVGSLLGEAVTSIEVNALGLYKRIYIFHYFGLNDYLIL